MILCVTIHLGLKEAESHRRMNTGFAIKKKLGLTSSSITCNLYSSGQVMYPFTFLTYNMGIITAIFSQYCVRVK